MLAGEELSREDVDHLLRRRAPEIALRLMAWGLGEAVECRGPTGKCTSEIGTAREQLRALEILADRIWPTLKVQDVTSSNTNLNLEAKPDEKELRKALLEHLESAGLSVRRETPAPVDSETPAPDCSADIAVMKSMGSNPAFPGRDADAFVDWPTEDSDPVPVPAPAVKPATIASGDNPDRIELGEGYFAVKGKTSTGADCWLCYAAGATHERGHSRIVRSPEAARDWFHNNNPAGLALKQGLRVIR